MQDEDEPPSTTNPKPTGQATSSNLTGAPLLPKQVDLQPSHLDEQAMPVSDDVEEGGAARRTATMINLVNTILGGGTLALPYAYQQAGLIIGVLLTILSYCLVMYSAKLVVWTSLTIRPRGVASYKGIAKAAFGRAGPVIVEIANSGLLLGAMVGYIVIMGEILAPFLDRVNASELVNYDVIVCGIAALILFPLSCLKTMNAMRFTSYVSVACLLFMILSIIVRSVQKITSPTDGVGPIYYARTHLGAFSAIPIITFAFTFHPTLIPMWKERRSRSEQKITVVLVVSVTVCAVVYILTGLFGYLSFRDQTSDNILENYPDDDKLMDVVKAMLVVMICLSYPVLLFPCREGIDQLLFNDPAPWWRRTIVAGWLTGVSLILAVTVTNISTVFGFVGSTVGQLVLFIFPALFYIILHGNVKPKYPHYHVKKIVKVSDYGSTSSQAYTYDSISDPNQLSLKVVTITQQEHYQTVELTEDQVEEVESMDLEHPSESFLARIARKYLTKDKWPCFILIITGIAFGMLGVVEIGLRQQALDSEA